MAENKPLIRREKEIDKALPELPLFRYLILQSPPRYYLFGHRKTLGLEISNIHIYKLSYDGVKSETAFFFG